MVMRLERELPRQLEDPRVEGTRDLTKVRTVDILIVPDREVRVVENIERFEPEFHAHTLFESRPLDQRRVHIPVTWPIDRCQTQATKRSRCRMRKERGVGAPVTRRARSATGSDIDQRRIKQ